MLDQADLKAREARLCGQIEVAFGVKSDDLSVAMRKIGRRLPKSVHAAAKRFSEAARMAAHPGLRHVGNAEQAEKAYQIVADALSAVDPADRRKAFAINVLATLAFNMLLVLALFVTVLVWRDLL